MVSLSTLIIFLFTSERIRPAKNDDIVSASSLDSNVNIIAVTPGAVTIKDISQKDSYLTQLHEYDNNNVIEGDNMNEQNKKTWQPATEMDLNPESITVFVNKEFCLPKDYLPKDLVMPNIPFDYSGLEDRKLMRTVAAEAIVELFAAAKDEGHMLYGVSGYRSYTRQRDIFLNNIVHKGKTHTLKYSAVPGVSEHQTGLAMDVSTKGLRYRLVTRFSSSPEGKWLAANAHYYGFIIRYGDNAIDITGYEYEPWHIRYVGIDLAKYLYDNDLTLEEYYNYSPSNDFDFEGKYASLINYKPPITPTPIPDPEDDLDDELDEELDDELGDELDDQLDDETDEDLEDKTDDETDEDRDDKLDDESDEDRDDKPDDEVDEDRDDKPDDEVDEDIDGKLDDESDEDRDD